ncbi:MAG: hypothetical protein AB7G21_08570 [Dehalococcoidia bacterium]
MSQPTPLLCDGTRRSGDRCGRRLLDIDADALRPGKSLHIKCRDCNHMTVLAGGEASEAA